MTEPDYYETIEQLQQYWLTNLEPRLQNGKTFHTSRMNQWLQAHRISEDYASLLWMTNGMVMLPFDRILKELETHMYDMSVDINDINNFIKKCVDAKMKYPSANDAMDDLLEHAQLSLQYKKWDTEFVKDELYKTITENIN